MPKVIGKATRVVEVNGLSIDEFVGNVGSQTDDMSVAVVKVSHPTSEPWLTLDYDEWMVVLKGTLEIHYDDSNDEEEETKASNKKVLTVTAGETVFIAKGERFQPVFPQGDTEYVPICIPAFKPERCLREEENGINTSDVSKKLDELHHHSQSKKRRTVDTDEKKKVEDYPDIIYHMCQKSLWEQAVQDGVAYYPPTFKEDGHFTHATAIKSRLLETANHFYTSTKGDWICLQLSIQGLQKYCGIVTIYEEPKSVGIQTVKDTWKTNEWKCPHIYGGIPTTKTTNNNIVVENRIVTNIYNIKRNEQDGTFLSIE